MKILLVTDRMQLGGAETHIATLARGLIKRGLTVTLVSAGGALADSLASIGVRCVFAPLDQRNLKGLKKSIDVLRREMRLADITHTHTRYSSFVASYVRGKQKFPPIMVTAHLNFPTFPFGPLTFWGDRTLAVSDDIKKYLCQSYNIPESRISLTKNCIDNSIFGGERCEKKLIVHTSRIDTGRAECAFMLTECAKVLLSRHPDFRILIIGGGNLFGKLKSAVAKTNTQLGFPGVMLSGPSHDVASFLRYASIFVGVSRAALEAMAFGIPTVISGDEGYGGIVTKNNFSILESTNFCARGMPSASIEALISDIEFLMENAQERKSLSEFCKSKIAKEYSSEIMSDDAIREYRKIKLTPSLCLMGYFGYGNLGDEETLRAAIGAFREMGIRDISTLSEGNLSGYDSELSVYRYDRMNPYSVSEAIRRYDVFIMCGGNLLQNETSGASLLYYESVIRFAKRLGKPIYILASGIGEVKGVGGNLLLQRSITSCDRFAMRTGRDKRAVNSIIKEEKALLMPDFCFLLKDGGTGSGIKGKFAYIISRDSPLTPTDIIRISSVRGLEPIVISLFKGDDEKACKIFENANIRCYYPKDFEGFKKLVSPCRFTICARLHGAIFSILSYTPAYINDISYKNRALLEEISDRCQYSGTSDILIPFSFKAVREKKEAEAKSSDFRKIINGLQKDILLSLKEIFD
jgi:polysaccharide pyruvyl transferase WcaK-like protein/glycosyltransferase involved in cell wall biosynthesis